MKNTVLLFMALIAVGNCFSQKIKIKEDIAYVDGTAFLKWDKRQGLNEISVSGLTSDKEEIYVMYLNYNDASKVTKSNPEGRVNYIELNFLTLGKKCEIDNRTQSALVRFILDNKIYVDGLLNTQNVDLVIQKYGMRYSENRPGGKVTIIVND